MTFQADGSFETSSGIAGVNVRSYRGSFWQRRDVLGLRGTGVGGGIHVQFVLARVSTEPALRLTVTEVVDEYVAEMIGKPDLGALEPGEVHDTVRRLAGVPLPREARGLVEVYEK